MALTAIGCIGAAGYPGAMAKPAHGARARQKPLKKQHPNRIRELARERGIKYGDIADHFGVHYTTIADLARGASNLTQDWMNKLGEFFGVEPAEIIARSSIATPGWRRVRVTGLLQAGAWNEQHEWPHDEQYVISIPDDAALRRIELYAGEVRGQSMNLRYPDRTIVVLSHVGSSPTEILPGRRYHIRRTRPDGLTEETIKTLVRDVDGRYWLKPESDHPDFQEWLPLDGTPGTTIELIGRVRFSVQREE